jgi:TP901 family phage tail tape measure protein
VTTVENLAVMVGCNISELTSGLNRADSSISGFVSNTGRQLATLGAGMTALTAPLTAFAVQGVNVASEFESSMAEISARTGIVGADLESISDFALQMGADTAFSAQQASDAFLQLLTSGSSLEEAYILLPEVLNAAAASGEDLGATADTITDIMASFGLEAEKIPPNLQAVADQFGLTDEMLVAWGDNLIDTTPEMERFARTTGATYEQMYEMFIATEDASDVVNILAKAAGASSASMGDLGQGFANVGGVAKSFGLDVETTAATLALFAENGIKGAEAGTNLKSMLLEMGSEVDENHNAFAELGVSLYDAQGNMRDFETVIGELDTALDALPAEEQNRLMLDLGGSYGIVGLNALRGSMSIGDMEDAMDGSADAATVAAARMATFKGRMDSLRGSVETLQILAFTPLMQNSLTPLVGLATEVVNAITEFIVVNPLVADTLMDMALAAMIAGPAIGAIGLAIMAASMPIVAIPLLATAAIAGIVGLVSAFDNFIGFDTRLEDFGDGIVVITTPLERLGQALSAIQIGDTTVGGIVAGIQTAIIDGINQVNIVAADVATIPGKISTAISDAFAGYGVQVQVIAGNIKTALTDAANQIAVTAEDMAAIPGKVGDAIGDAFAANFGGLGELTTTIQAELQAAIEGIEIPAVNLDGVTNSLSTGLETAFGSVSSIQIDTAGIGQWAADNFNAVASVIINVGWMIFGGPVWAPLALGQLVATAIQNDFMGIGTFLQESGIAATVEGAFGDLKATIDGIIAAVFGGGEQTVVSPAAFDFTGMDTSGGAGATAGLTQLAADIQMAINGIVSVAGSISKDVIGGLEDLGAGVGDFIEGISGAETEGLYEVVRAIAGFIGGLVLGAAQAAGIGLGAILSGIGNALGPFGEAIGSLITSVSRLGEGDIGGALVSLGEGALHLAGGIIAVPVGVMDSLIEKFNELTGLDLPTITEAFNGLGTGLSQAWFGLQVITDNIKRGIELFVLDIQMRIMDFLVNVRGLVLDASAGRIDIAPNIVMDRNKVVGQIAQMNMVDLITQELNDSMAQGDVQINPASIHNLVLFSDDLAANASVQFKDAVQRGITMAAGEGDVSMFQALLPVAIDMGIPLEDLMSQFDEAVAGAATSGIYNTNADIDLMLVFNRMLIERQIKAAIEGGDYSAQVNAAVDVFVSPNVIVGGSGPQMVPDDQAGGGTTATSAASPSSPAPITPSSPIGPSSAGTVSASGTTNVYNITGYGETPYELANMIEKAVKEKGL